MLFNRQHISAQVRAQGLTLWWGKRSLLGPERGLADANELGQKAPSSQGMASTA